MRHACILLIVLALLPVGCAPDPNAVVVRSADALAPGDLGVGKYLFEASPRAGKVMVLRCTETCEGRQKGDVLESILSSNGAVAQEAVLVYDPAKFPFGDGKSGTLRVKAQAGERSYGHRRCTSTSIAPGRLKLEFTHATEPAITLTYECFMEEYAKAKARVPDLPEQTPAVKWTYGASFPQK